MNFLVPTKRPRLNEAVGLVLFTLTVLVLLSLVSYHPTDPSFNVSRDPLSDSSVQNFIGRFGSTLADLLLQVLGYPAFLLPVIFSIFGWKWIRSRQMQNPWAKCVGIVCLVGSSCALLGLLFPNYLTVGWSLKAGGIVGDLLSDWFRARFNMTGSLIVVLAWLFVSLLVATRFSFSVSLVWLNRHFAFLGVWWEYWLAWCKSREKARERKLLEKKLQEEEKGNPRGATLITQTIMDLKERGPASARRIPKEPSPRDMDFAEPLAPIAPKKSQVEKAPPLTIGTYDFVFPSINMLRPPVSQRAVDENELLQRANQLMEKCKEFDVHGQVHHIHPGPVVTTYEFKPEAGVKYSKITNLVDDLCLALKAESVRIDRLPGKSTVGVEVPNVHRETIFLREIIESAEFQNSHSKLTIALGKDIVGKIVVADLAKMPHLLIAGQTGSGKSVAVNSMIISILYKATPAEVKFIMVDPKRLELGLYEDIPHLLTPVVAEPKRASNALKWATNEMESRYKLLAAVGVRNIEQYNALVKKPKNLELFSEEENSEKKPLPFIVIVIDELADLMMVASKDVEDSIMRLAQMARAVGIHLIVATQRPSVDVITGVIKANFPSRISFRVAQKVDSRTILDQMGAQQLLGKGDMLFIPPGSSKMMRVHGPYVTEEETAEIVRHLKLQGQPVYNQTVLEDSGPTDEKPEMDQEVDEMYEEAVRIVVEMGKASTSTLQRRLRLGYGRAARLIDMMERDGIVGPADGSKPREVLKKKEYFREYDEERSD
ncbi:MAG: cell division protein FtsK [Acidobacteria bacterium]|nr:MAG: cell division protein FtsK [Acidobacteriota bacterium]